MNLSADYNIIAEEILKSRNKSKNKGDNLGEIM